MDIQKILQSETFTRTIIGVGAAITLLIVFEAGMFVGEHKAGLAYRMGDNYYRAVGHGPSDTLFEAELPAAHGAAGKIVSVTLPHFVVEENNNTEKVIAITASTTIRSLRDATSSAALMPGQYVIIIGEPEETGDIEAHLIRLLPPPPQ